MCRRNAYHSHWGNHHHYRHEARKQWKAKLAKMAYPPVNMAEQEDQYQIKLYAAGYEKSDFLVKLQGDILIISVENAGQESHPFQSWGQFDFTPGNFKRKFELSEKVDKEGIAAEYKEGILTITLPKLEGFASEWKDIGVA